MDRRRVNGPEVSVPPIFKETKELQNEILNNERKRLDNRGLEDLRAICKLSFYTFSSANQITK